MNIFKRLAAVLAAVFILCLIPADVRAGSYVVTVYNERNGLPTGEANAVIQTSDGYIWIGSYGGLIRYDGSSFRNFSLEGIFPSSSVRALFEDRSGTLWIGTNDAGVFTMRGGKPEHIEPPADNSFLCVRGFDQGADGTVYAASSSGIAAVKDGVLIPCEDENILGRTVYSAAVDSYGRVWGAMDSSVCVISPDGVRERIFASDEFFDDGSDIYCTAADSSGNIYIGSSGQKILRLSFPDSSLDPSDMEISEFTTESVTTHNSIVPAADGRMIVCGNAGSCLLSPDGTEYPFGTADKASAVNSGCIDYEGNIWLASTSRGIIKYTQGCFDSPNNAAGLDDVPLNAVSEQGGIFYAATDSGILAFDSNWQPVSNAVTELYDGVRVRSLMTDSRGDLWTAAYSYDIPVSCCSPDGSITSFNEKDGLVNTSARNIYELSDGTVAVGTQGGISLIRDGKIFRSYDAGDGLAVSSVLCFLETDRGTLLAGSDGGGIYEIDIDGGSVSVHGFDEGLAEGVVLRMLKDPEGDGYFISAGSSLYYWEDQTFRKLSVNKGAGSIFDLYCRDGILWILQNNGILAFDRQAVLSGREVHPREYSFEQGLTGSVNANTWNYEAADGKLYISTRSGISVFGFDPAKTALPKGIVNSVSVDGEVYDYPENISLSRNSGRVTVDIAALSYTGTANIGISYILEGFDKEETVTVGECSEQISYTNLPGGDYTFRLKIFDPEDPENCNVREFSITKEMKIYERPFFLPVLTIILIAASVGIVAIVLQAKIRNIRRRQKEYRSIIEQSLQTFARTIDAKDPYTNGHSLRVAKYSAELARRMGKSVPEQENIYYIALLHDIGKIGIPDSILKKPGKLTDEEREIIRRHPMIGGEILKDFTALEGIADGAKYHHERYDGTGYCEKLAGRDIPEVARIIGVADTYDAMSSNRVYVKAYSDDTIVRELKEASGTQLDPEIVPVMLSMIEDGFAPIRSEDQ